MDPGAFHRPWEGRLGICLVSDEGPFKNFKQRR